MEDKKEDVQKQIDSLIEYHTKDLEQIKENLKIPGLKTISKQLLEQAILDKEELIRNLKGI